MTPPAASRPKALPPPRSTAWISWALARGLRSSLSLEAAMHYIKEIRSPYFKIYPDMGNLTQFSADVESEFELGISETVAIHVKETNPGVFKCVPFGEGTVRFTDIFKKLKDLNYTGMFLIEMWADNTKKQTMEEAVETIRQARLFVEDKMEQAGIKVPA